MGTCKSCNNTSAAKDLDVFNIIITSSTKMLVSILRKLLLKVPIETIDSMIAEHDKKKINPLGLCFLLGKASKFAVFLSHKSDITIMEKLLYANKIDPINYLIINGYIDLLKIYLPIYNNAHEKYHKTSIVTLDFNSIASTNRFVEYPIHLACEKGKINIVYYFYEFFSEFCDVPYEFSIESKNETRGENCALIACRNGDIAMAKVLHEACKANFHIFNEYRENALMVCIAGMNSNPDFNYLNLIVYLVEVVKVDITYNHEELIVMIQYQEVFDYLKKKLNEKGIQIKENLVNKEIVRKTLTKTISDTGTSFLLPDSEMLIDYSRPSTIYNS
jgi:ankyrin repeat protein